jgi:hypothetical protein
MDQGKMIIRDLPDDEVCVGSVPKVASKF